MSYASTRDCVEDLERHQHLVRIPDEVDPHLEMAEIQRRVYAAGGPAVLFERVKGSDFPAVSNLFGSLERSKFIFRHTLEGVRRAIELKADPSRLLRAPFRYLGAPLTGLRSLPARRSSGPVLRHKTTVSALPAVHCWPDDGGRFVTLPQVYSEDPARRRPLASNLGMYRVQLDGNEYRTDEEVGLHYQIHRGIGVHHKAALDRGQALPVTVHVGGPPAHTVAAVMPLPEGLSEVVFAGMLAGRRVRHAQVEIGEHTHRVFTDADFAIVGTVSPGRTKPEGPFGDHLGYYSLTHDFPVLDVHAVYHRPGAIWPFTVVGRPPQEDTTFGALIHELTEPMVPVSIAGLVGMHAVDAAGVHPLMLALGSERYAPFFKGRRRPQELLTIANAILGFNQASLAKVLCILDHDDVVGLRLDDEEGFFGRLLERVDLSHDLHFQTKTTIDTLDYSGESLNAGSKLVIAAVGEPVRTLATSLPQSLSLPDAWTDPRIVAPGIVAVSGPPWTKGEHLGHIDALATHLARLPLEVRDQIPLVVACDDAEFVARRFENFLWAAFTRVNPSHDIHGVESFVEHKHWGCAGPLIFDARRKPHHAPPLVEDPAVSARVDALAARGGPLHGIV